MHHLWEGEIDHIPDSNLRNQHHLSPMTVKVFSVARASIQSCYIIYFLTDRVHSHTQRKTLCFRPDHLLPALSLTMQTQAWIYLVCSLNSAAVSQPLGCSLSNGRESNLTLSPVQRTRNLLTPGASTLCHSIRNQDSVYYQESMHEYA